MPDLKLVGLPKDDHPTVDDFASLFTDSELDSLDSVAVWQRTCGSICQRLTQLPINNWDAELVGLFWNLTNPECKTQIAEFLTQAYNNNTT